VDVQNLFNINRIVSFTNVSVRTDPITGEVIGPLPDFRSQAVSQESRQAQIGIKFHF